MAMGSVITPFSGWKSRPRHIVCGKWRSFPREAVGLEFIFWERSDIFSANVRCHLPPLAFGTKGCSAADVPKVPKAWWLGGQPRSDYFFV